MIAGKPQDWLTLHNLVMEAYDYAQTKYNGHGWYHSDVTAYLYDHGLRAPEKEERSGAET